MDIKHALKPPAGTSFLTERDQEDVRQRARRRRMAALEDRELLRLELKDRYYLEKLHGYLEKLDRPSELTGRDIQAIKTGSDIALKLLAKVLPDLKSVEKHEDPLNEADKLNKLSTAELTALARQRLNPIEGECEVVQASPEPVQEPAPVLSVPPNNLGPNRWPFG